MSDKFAMYLDEDNSISVSRFEKVCPALIAAAVRAGTKLDVFDEWSESLNVIVAYEIEKAGALVE